MTDNRDELMAKLHDCSAICVYTLDERGLRHPHYLSDEEMAALRTASSSAAVPVAVKPLEWSDAGEVIFQKWCAETHFDTGYVLTKQFIGLKDHLYLIHHEDEFLWSFDDEATAKAAAQADFEQRIRSALIATPAAAGVREALKNAFGFLMGDDPLHQSGGHLNIDLRKEISAALASAGADKSSDGGEPSPTYSAHEVVMPKYEYQKIDNGTYSADYSGARVTTVRKLVDDPNSASGKSLRDVEVSPAPSTDQRREEIAREIATKCFDPTVIDVNGKLFWKPSHWRCAELAADAILALDGGDRG